MALTAKKKKKPETDRLKVPVYRHPDFSTGDLLINSLEVGLQQEEVSFEGTDKYLHYAGKPLDFLSQELGAKFPPKIEEVILSVENIPITVAKSSNGYGKTFAAAHIAAYWLCCHPDSQVWTTMPQPEDNLKKLLWGEIGLIVNNHPELFENFENISLPSMTVQRHPKSGLYGVTIPGAGSEQNRESRFSGKHAPYILFIVDEADGVPDEIFRAIEGCLSGGVARLLCMFNPKMETGAVYNFIKNNQANVIELNALGHPNVVTGKDIYPGAVTRDKTVNRFHLWTEPLGPDDEIDDSCVEVPDFLVGHVAPTTGGGFHPPLAAGYRRIIDPQFSYAVLAQYPTLAEGQLIDKAKLKKCVERWKLYHEAYKNEHPMPHEYIAPFAGLDLAETTDDNSLCFRHDFYVPPLITWRGINTAATARKAAGIAKRRNAQYVNTDANGLGSNAHILIQEEGMDAHGIKVTWRATEKDEDFGEFDSYGDQGWWLLRQWIHNHPNAMIPDDDKLIEELKIQMYWKTPKGRIKVHSADYFREKLGRSPDRAISLVLTHCPPPVEDEPGELFVESYIHDDDEMRDHHRVGLGI